MLLSSYWESFILQGSLPQCHFQVNQRTALKSKNPLPQLLFAFPLTARPCRQAPQTGQHCIKLLEDGLHYVVGVKTGQETSISRRKLADHSQRLQPGQLQETEGSCQHQPVAAGQSGSNGTTRANPIFHGEKYPTASAPLQVRLLLRAINSRASVSDEGACSQRGGKPGMQQRANARGDSSGHKQQHLHARVRGS